MLTPGGSTRHELLSRPVCDKQLTLTTTLGASTERVEGTTLSMACPDGAFCSASAFGLLRCESSFSSLPGTATSGGGTSVSFSLLGGAGGSVPIFVCQSAQ
jgi:hypothetical protein